MTKLNKTPLHSFTILSYIFILAIISMSYTHPVYLGALFLITIMGIISTGELAKLKTYLLFGLSMSFFIVIINILVSTSGATTFKFLSLTITKEALFYGLNMGLKLTLIILVFCLLGSLLDSDRAFNTFSKIFPKSSLLVILTSCMIPNMKRSYADIGFTMKMRGAQMDSKNIFTRIRSSSPLLKVLLLSSLEDSHDTALALHARAFGTGKRTNYYRESFIFRDFLIFFSVLFTLLGFIFSIIYKNGFLTFYPRIEHFWLENDLFFILWITLGLLILPLSLLIGKKWNSIK